MIAQQILNASIEVAFLGTLAVMGGDYLRQIAKAVSRVRAEHKAALLASPGAIVERLAVSLERMESSLAQLEEIATTSEASLELAKDVAADIPSVDIPDVNISDEDLHAVLPPLPAPASPNPPAKRQRRGRVAPNAKAKLGLA